MYIHYIYVHHPGQPEKNKFVILNPGCFCSIDTKTAVHHFLYCHFYNTNRLTHCKYSRPWLTIIQ